VVLLAIEDCPSGTLRLADAYQAAHLELEQAGIRSVDAEASGTPVQAELTARVRCEQGVEASLTLRIPNDTESASRFVSLDDANPKDRPRLLGLALAELVRSDWATLVERSTAKEVAAAKAAKEPPAPLQEPAAAPAAAAAKSSRAAPEADDVDRGGASGTREPSESQESSELAFTADAIVRWFTVSPGITVGAAFGLERGRFSVGVEAAVGRHVSERGSADYGFGAATLGAAVLRAVSNKSRFTLGPTLALGGTWATGESRQADVEVSGTGGLYADARLDAAGAVRLGAVELGARVSGGRATGLELVDRGSIIGATGGWFVGGALGMRF
jgi:hypothetical protein